MCGCLLHAPNKGPGLCPNRGSNPSPFSSQAGTQSTEPQQPGPKIFYFNFREATTFFSLLGSTGRRRVKKAQREGASPPSVAEEGKGDDSGLRTQPPAPSPPDHQTQKSRSPNRVASLHQHPPHPGTLLFRWKAALLSSELIRRGM